MRASVKYFTIFVAGLLVAVSTPVVARTVVDFARFARNAHRVDGLHAVTAATSPDRRSRQARRYKPTRLSPQLDRPKGRPS